MGTNKNEQKSENPSVTREEFLQMLSLIQKINDTSHKVYQRYTAALDFIEAKGLKREFDDYLLSRLGEN